MANWTKVVKAAANWTKTAKPTAGSWTKLVKSIVAGFLLMEDGAYLLQETAQKIALSMGASTTTYTKVAKESLSS